MFPLQRRNLYNQNFILHCMNLAVYPTRYDHLPNSMDIIATPDIKVFSFPLKLGVADLKQTKVCLPTSEEESYIKEANFTGT